MMICRVSNRISKASEYAAEILSIVLEIKKLKYPSFYLD
jgi:hypothetical protein